MSASVPGASCLDHQLVSTLGGGGGTKLRFVAVGYLDRQSLLRQEYRPPLRHMTHTCTHTARADLQTLIKLMCMFWNCGRKLERTHTGTGGNFPFQSCDGRTGFKLASCSNNFKTRAFKDSSYLWIPEQSSLLQRSGRLKEFPFIFIQRALFCVTIVSGL